MAHPRRDGETHETETMILRGECSEHNERIGAVQNRISHMEIGMARLHSHYVEHDPQKGDGLRQNAARASGLNGRVESLDGGVQG